MRKPMRRKSTVLVKQSRHLGEGEEPEDRDSGLWKMWGQLCQGMAG